MPWYTIHFTFTLNWPCPDSSLCNISHAPTVTMVNVSVTWTCSPAGFLQQTLSLSVSPPSYTATHTSSFLDSFSLYHSDCTSLWYKRAVLDTNLEYLYEILDIVRFQCIIIMEMKEGKATLSFDMFSYSGKLKQTLHNTTNQYRSYQNRKKKSSDGICNDSYSNKNWSYTGITLRSSAIGIL